jgi:hypothetical protein
MEKFITYLYINAVSLSVFLNTLLGGKPYQTFSARNWERYKESKPNLVYLIDLLTIWLEKDHCMHCWIRWRIGRYAIMKYDSSEKKYD